MSVLLANLANMRPPVDSLPAINVLRVHFQKLMNLGQQRVITVCPVHTRNKDSPYVHHVLQEATRLMGRPNARFVHLANLQILDSLACFAQVEHTAPYPGAQVHVLLAITDNSVDLARRYATPVPPENCSPYTAHALFLLLLHQRSIIPFKERGN